ncbi:hypothetical protein HBI56_220750 [Parastagonospora nodorum]|nr:hypothetical protein HBH51_246710 [Parastagonospora nodorum]KAH4013425.1 hypothetical protein HBI09_214540 [Parastagonospora nodorum]KAH4216891.1 hypothetical protein HBI06_223470 [Parastagonospora nodorum]KAH4226231.1 hypothetical protein HBI05_225160 [Parastagonospora nodorum]KAH4892776.1 hypothetical protein HBH74_205600 [Parastagonospora nodorum]
MACATRYVDARFTWPASEGLGRAVDREYITPLLSISPGRYILELGLRHLIYNLSLTTYYNICKGEQCSKDSSFDLQAAIIVSTLSAQATYYYQFSKGANEATRTLNRGTSKLIIMASDAELLAFTLYLSLLCEDKNAPFVYVPSKMALGRALTSNEASDLTGQIRAMNDAVERIAVLRKGESRNGLALSY